MNCPNCDLKIASATFCARCGILSASDFKFGGDRDSESGLSKYSRAELVSGGFKILLAVVVLIFVLMVAARLLVPGQSAREKALVEDCQQLVIQTVSGDYINERERMIAAASEVLGKSYSPTFFVETYQNLSFLDLKYESGYISGTYSAESSGGGPLSGQFGRYSCFVDGSTVTLDDYEYPK